MAKITFFLGILMLTFGALQAQRGSGGGSSVSEKAAPASNARGAGGKSTPIIAKKAGSESPDSKGEMKAAPAPAPAPASEQARPASAPSSGGKAKGAASEAPAPAPAAERPKGAASEAPAPASTGGKAKGGNAEAPSGGN